jgi:hypothetical protein
MESSHFVEPSFSFDIGLRYYFTLF